MVLIQRGRDFLESSTIHGLAHISTGKNAFIRCIWAMIVIACFSYDIYMIENAFQSWAANPVVTSVDTKPIEQVSLPEITVCPPSGTNTALNLDLVTAEEVELSETQRENLTLAALENLHKGSIDRFIEEQASFHSLQSIHGVYEGLQQMLYAFTVPGFSFNGVDFPDSFHHETVMSSSGALEGSYSTLGWGQLVTESNLKPALEFTYKAYISPQVFTAEAPLLVVQVDSNTEESPVPFGNVPSTDVGELVTLNFGEEEDTYGGAGYVNFTQTFELNPKDPQCEFTVKFSRNFIQQKLGTLATGLSVSWFIMDAFGNRIVAENGTGFQEENSTQILCKTEETDSDDEELLTRSVTRWFNIFHHYYSVAGMEVTSIWELVRSIKVNRLWKENALVCDSFYSEQLTTNFAKGNLQDDEIAELLNEFDEGGVIDAEPTLSKDDLPSEVWMEAFRMFSHIAYCPSSETEAWAQFYEDTLGHSPPRQVLQKVAQILNRKVAERSDTITETGLYEMLAGLISFKAAAATVGLSTDKELLGQLDSPVLGSLKEPLVGRTVVLCLQQINRPQVGCLQTNQCADLEAAVNSISKLEYEQAKHRIQVVRMILLKLWFSNELTLG